MSNSAPDGVITMSQATSSLLNEEERRKGTGESQTQTDALVIEGRGRQFTRKENNRGRSKSRPRKEIECYHCHKKGHYKSECRLLKKKNNEGGKAEDKKDREVAAVASGEDIILFTECVDQCLATTSNQVDWVVDTGASYHATPRREFFTSYRTGDLGVIRMGNNGVFKICGIEEVVVQTREGSRLILKEVRHVLDLRMNLISAGKLDEEGYVSQFRGDKWKLIKGAMVITKGQRSCTLYKLQSSLVRGEVCIAEHDTADLWHKRLGHIGGKGLQTLIRAGVLPEIQGRVLSDCTHCGG